MTFTNAPQFRREAKQAFADLALDSEDQLADLARDMSKEMRDNAPVMDAVERYERQQTESGRETVRKTPGKTTIRFARGRDREGFYIDVGPNKGAFYLSFVEWGTSKMAARPFLRPAIEAAIARWGG